MAVIRVMGIVLGILAAGLVWVIAKDPEIAKNNAAGLVQIISSALSLMIGCALGNRFKNDEPK